MPGVRDEDPFVYAADEVCGGFCLGGRTDEVLGPRDVEHRAREVREVHPPAAQLELTPDQPVLLVEVLDPASKGLAGERYSVIYRQTARKVSRRSSRRGRLRTLA